MRLYLPTLYYLSLTRCHRDRHGHRDGDGLFQVVYYPGRDSDTRAVTVTPPPSQAGTAVLVATRNVALGHGE